MSKTIYVIPHKNKNKRFSVHISILVTRTQKIAKKILIQLSQGAAETQEPRGTNNTPHCQRKLEKGNNSF